MTAFDYVAFGAMAIVFAAVIYLVILAGDLPANIAKQRNHPQVAAIRAMAMADDKAGNLVLQEYNKVKKYDQPSDDDMAQSMDTVRRFSEVLGDAGE